MTSRRITGILHVLLALAVVHQLATSLFFDPRQYSFGITLRWTHDRVGLATGVLLGLFWVWTIIRHNRPGFFDFFLWFFPRRLKRVGMEAWDLSSRIMRAKAIPDGHHRQLAAAIQGIGLIVASILALSGAYLHFYARPTLVPPSDIRQALTIHLAAADLMWLFLIGHGTMATVHFASRAIKRSS